MPENETQWRNREREFQSQAAGSGRKHSRSVSMLLVTHDKKFAEEATPASRNPLQHFPLP
jgi:hypothetical protein